MVCALFPQQTIRTRFVANLPKKSRRHVVVVSPALNEWTRIMKIFDENQEQKDTSTESLSAPVDQLSISLPWQSKVEKTDTIRHQKSDFDLHDAEHAGDKAECSLFTPSQESLPPIEKKEARIRVGTPNSNDLEAGSEVTTQRNIHDPNLVCWDAPGEADNPKTGLHGRNGQLRLSCRLSLSLHPWLHPW